MKKTLIATLMLAALGSVAPAWADGITLALTGPYSGGSAPMGVSMRDGAKLAINEINANGGVDVGGKKQKITVIERDDEAKNERGALIAQELASMDGLTGVIGSANTGVVIAGDKFLQEKGIPKIITPAAGSAAMTQWKGKAPTGLSIFRFAAHDGIQTAMVVREAINRNYTKVALLCDSTNYGKSGHDDLLNQIKAQGGKLQVVADDKFNIGDKDMSAQLLRAKAAGAQAVLVWGIGPELAAIANGKAKLGMKEPLIGGWTFSMSNYIDNAGKNGDGTLMPQTFIEEPVTPKADAFINSYRRNYDVKHIPSPVSAAQGYDAVLIFAAAIHQAGSTDPKKVVAALEDLQAPVPGVIATWNKPFSKWNPDDVNTHEAFTDAQTVMGMVKNGTVTFAHPEDKARLAKAAAGKKTK